MFTTAELQLIAKTLTTRRDWLSKNIDNPEMAAQKTHNQEALTSIEAILSKITLKLKGGQPPHVDIVSTPTRPVKLSPIHKRQHMLPADIKVLVVDDDNLIASMIEGILNSVGIDKVEIADDGIKAINMLYQAKPVYDLVLCDWNMPNKNGLDVHTAMRATERYIDTCFMLVTAVTETKKIREAIEEGVDDYMVKPIEEDKTIKKIARHFPNIKSQG